MKLRPTTATTVIAAIAIPLLAPAQDQPVVQEEKTTTTTTTTETITFAPEYRTKVVRYFETYRARPYGLPPKVVESVKIQSVPKTWWTTEIRKGYVIPKEEVGYLAPAPVELVKVLPAAEGPTKYYVMGRNVVAVDTTEMRVVDAVRVPTVKFEDGETIISEPGKTTTIEEDGDVEVEPDDDDDDDDD
jgi:hypothetical protein